MVNPFQVFMRKPLRHRDHQHDVDVFDEHSIYVYKKADKKAHKCRQKHKNKKQLHPKQLLKKRHARLSASNSRIIKQFAIPLLLMKINFLKAISGPFRCKSAATESNHENRTLPEVRVKFKTKLKTQGSARGGVKNSPI